MSVDTVCYYQRTIPHDPHHLDPPSVDESTYPPDCEPLQRYKKFVKKTRRFRDLHVQLLECLDHKSSASERLATCSRQLPKSERPRVFKAFANYEKYQVLIVLKVKRWHIDKTGLCEAGYVPCYYGWYEFPPSWRSDPALAHISNHPRLSELPQSETPPRALLIEYLETASPISPWNITTEVAHEALRRLTEIHSIGLLYHDAYPRNLMVTRDGKPIWIPEFDPKLKLESTARLLASSFAFFLPIMPEWFAARTFGIRLFTRRLLLRRHRLSAHAR
ncbi:hypothetical protein SISSUDRAFT_1065023 [Sistotremastrum suecicum HHB10207 ss-3]|uniref:Protein kinase domain-containing protein n=1 Tax=Sistotremastrum suecicum HHB10207 ss-3 TaxID=1314776 RepID=A0A165ZZN1_9AGAM|nr:hypothetical protein SISSUDRAFT_1065023 [Sistotremastrum suecicum HHB10207 ss-3]